MRLESSTLQHPLPFHQYPFKTFCFGLCILGNFACVCFFFSFLLLLFVSYFCLFVYFGVCLFEKSTIRVSQKFLNLNWIIFITECFQKVIVWCVDLFTNVYLDLGDTEKGSRIMHTYKTCHARIQNVLSEVVHLWQRCFFLLLFFFFFWWGEGGSKCLYNGPSSARKRNAI